MKINNRQSSRKEIANLLSERSSPVLRYRRINPRDAVSKRSKKDLGTFAHENLLLFVTVQFGRKLVWPRIYNSNNLSTVDFPTPSSTQQLR